VERGTKIVLHLKADATSFAKKEEVTKIVKKYSNFVNYPILVDEERLNNVLVQNVFFPLFPPFPAPVFWLFFWLFFLAFLSLLQWRIQIFCLNTSRRTQFLSSSVT
jgi:hypothetical protein